MHYARGPSWSASPRHVCTFIASMGGGVTAYRRCALGNRESPDAAEATVLAVPPARFWRASLRPALPTSQQSSTPGCTGDGRPHIVPRRAVAHNCLVPAAAWFFGSSQARGKRARGKLERGAPGERQVRSELCGTSCQPVSLLSEGSQARGLCHRNDFGDSDPAHPIRAVGNLRTSWRRIAAISSTRVPFSRDFLRSTSGRSHTGASRIGSSRYRGKTCQWT
jgi:hypothetical protein